MDTTRQQHTGTCLIIATACAMILALLGPLMGTAAAEGAQDVPLDLAAMALQPADLVAEDLDGHGISFSILSERSRDISAFLERYDSQVRDGEAFEAANPDRTYMLTLAHEVEAGTGLDVTVASTHLVASWTMEFANDEAAGEGIVEMRDALLSMKSTDDERVSSNLGDERFLVSGIGVDPWEDFEFERMTLAFQVDNLVTGITIYDYAGDDVPTRTLMEALGGRQLERVETVLDGDAPGLSGQLLRLRVPGDQVNAIYYLSLDGEAIRSSADSDKTLADKQGLYDEFDVVTHIHSEVLLGGDFEDYAAYFSDTLFSFADEDAAIEFMDTFEADSMAMSEAKVETPAIGDDAFTSTRFEERTGFTRHTYRIFVRVGTSVAMVTHALNTAVSDPGVELQPDAINELAMKQVECLTGEESCARATSVPREMRIDETSVDPGSLLSPLLPVLGRRELIAA